MAQQGEANMAAVLSAQIVTLNDTIGRMQMTINEMEDRLRQAEDDSMRNAHRGRGYRGGDDDDDGGGGDKLMSNKFFAPTAFTKSSGSWREWAEDFVDYISMRDEELAEALNMAPLAWG